MMPTSTWLAPAKVNLYLHVTGKRADGYHLLNTGFAFINSADQLHISTHSALHVSCSQAHLQGENNLVYQLLEAFRSRYDVEEGLCIHIHKHLPEQAGLGGGSSDAATALIAANRMWNLHLSMAELIQFATPFGADIPCFLFGKASIANGVGDQLTVLQDKLPDGYVVIAHPGTGLSTADVFRSFDRQLTTSGVGDTMPPASLDTLLGDNDLEVIACELCPPLRRLLRRMRTLSERVWMSGSGTACVALVDSRDEAAIMADRLKLEKFASWCCVERLLSSHPLFD
ncbi:MAG: 4-(cytidine 5'-diphospho)-2-C-methyl-D-erythritol kinase [Mariprofundaceae bacterium]